jgi:hypothetical protein
MEQTMEKRWGFMVRWFSMFSRQGVDFPKIWAMIEGSVNGFFGLWTRWTRNLGEILLHTQASSKGFKV